MLEFLLLMAFCWLFFKTLGLAFRVTWGLAKFAASLLFAVALPLMIALFLLAGGVMLVIPLAMVATAFVILKALV